MTNASQALYTSPPPSLCICVAMYVHSTIIGLSTVPALPDAVHTTPKKIR